MHGLATGYFKIRYGVVKDSRIRMPNDSTNYWVVMDKPTRLYHNNQAHHDMARLRRVAGTFAATTGTTPVIIYKDGSDCTLTDGVINRVLTITTDSIPTNIKITVDGTRVRPDVHYSITTSSTGMVITFDGVRVWDTQYISIDYFV